MSVKTYQLNSESKLIKVWPTLESAAKAFGLHRTSIRNAARYGHKSGGYRWSFRSPEQQQSTIDARRKIEDIRMAKSLGIELGEFA